MPSPADACARHLIDAMHDRRVDLLDLRQRPQVAVLVDRAQRLQKQRAIALDVLLRVVRRQSQVQGLAAVTR